MFIFDGLNEEAISDVLNSDIEHNNTGDLLLVKSWENECYWHCTKVISSFQQFYFVVYCTYRVVNLQMS